MVSQHFERFGFALSKENGDDTIWLLDIETYTDRQTGIKVN